LSSVELGTQPLHSFDLPLTRPLQRRLDRLGHRGGEDRAALATSAVGTDVGRTARSWPITTSTVHSPSAVALKVTVTSAGRLTVGPPLGCGRSGLLSGAAGRGSLSRGGTGGRSLFCDGAIRFGARLTGCRARVRVGRVLVSSLGEQNIVSRVRAGLTWMKSLSIASSIEITLAEPPAGTPTAAEVNHTVNGLPASNSVRAAARSCSDSGFDATIVGSLASGALAVCPGGPTGSVRGSRTATRPHLPS
jgi:hypothetical protein